MQTPRFRLYTTNSLKSLSDSYVRERRRHPGHFRPDLGLGHPDLFFREYMGVASRGMGVWLKQRLVESGQVVVNVEFPLVRQIVEGLLASFMSGEKSYCPELFRDDVLVWRIYRKLADFKGEIVSAYLGRDASGTPEQAVRRYQLSRKLAQMYYDYMALVPEKLHPDESGQPELPASDNRRWQLDLWRELCVDDDGRAVISPAQAMLRFLRPETRLLAKDYCPVTLFGISAMPPYYLRVMKKLATVHNVNFFYLNHCDDLWDNVKSDWEDSRDSSGFSPIEDRLDDVYSNTLLGNFGQQGREFFKAVMDLDNDVEEHTWSETEGDSAGKSACTTLLSDIQGRILHNTDVPGGGSHSDWRTDDSLTIHSCFSDLREVEALHDCILRLLSEYSEPGQDGQSRSRLALNDIVVMAPDISRFAPMIRAVFGNGPLRNSFGICDRSLRETNLTAQAFMSILELTNSQFAISRMDALLDSAALRNRFDFSDEDVSTIREWFRAGGIRWGQDGASRGDGCPYEEYSWRYGLDRLLLKLAVDGVDADDKEHLGFAGLFPADINTGKEQMTLLGSLHRLFTEVSAFIDEMGQTDRSAGDWCRLLLEKRSVFFKPDGDSAREYAALGKAVTEIREAMETAGLAGLPLPFSVVQAAISSELDLTAKGEPFLNGKITFCSLLPMRGIPCKVIAMLGMDSGEFPRPNDGTSFTLVNRQGAGSGSLLKYYDRSRSVEDRFTFLEALMSAEDYLMIFYRGQDDMTMQELNAAAPVVELLAYKDRLLEAVRQAGGDDAPPAKWPLVVHRLNGFDPLSFGKIPAASQAAGEPKRHTGALLTAFSFDRVMHDVALQGNAAQVLAEPEWLSACRLPVPADERSRNCVVGIDLREVLRFLRAPTDVYVETRLGLPRAEWIEDELCDYEPFEMDAQSRSHMKGELARDAAERGLGVDDWPAMLGNSALQRAKCVLPLGRMGEAEYRRKLVEAWILDETYRRLFGMQERGEAREYELCFEARLPDLGGDEDGPAAPRTIPVRLTGQFKAAWNGVCVCSFASELSPRYVIEGYLKHLMMCAQRQREGVGHASVESMFWCRVGGREQIKKLPEIEDAAVQLKAIVELYLLGRCYPLMLFGDASPTIALGNQPKTAFQRDMRRASASLMFQGWKEWDDVPEDARKTIADLAEKCYRGLKFSKKA